MHDKGCLGHIWYILPYMGMSDKSDKGDKMDIWDVRYEGPNTDAEGIMLKAGEMVQLVRVVTIVYKVNVSDYLDGADETGITAKTLIEREMDVMGISDVLDNEDKTVIEDDTVISVKTV